MSIAQSKGKPAPQEKPQPKRNDPNGHPTAPNTDSDDPHSTHRREDPDSPRNPGDLPDQKLAASDEPYALTRQIADKGHVIEAGARSFVLALLLLTGSSYLGASPRAPGQQSASPSNDGRADRSSNFVAV